MILRFSGLLCYNCDSVRHGQEICGRTSSLTKANTDHIDECAGYCKIASFRRGYKTYYLRMCDVNRTSSGCEEINQSRDETLSLCICKYNYCNIDFQSGNSPSVVSLASLSSGSPPGWPSLKVVSVFTFGITLRYLF